MEPLMAIYIGCMVVLSLAASKNLCKKKVIKKRFKHYRLH